jgi:hypothetical protein
MNERFLCDPYDLVAALLLATTVSWQIFSHKGSQRAHIPIQMDFGKNQVRLFFCFVLSVFFCGKKSLPGF